LLDAGGFDLIDELEQLPLALGELGAGLSKAAVLFGELAEVGELFRGRRDVLRAPLAAIGEDGAFVEFAPGAAAVGLAALSPQGVEGSGEQRLAAEKGFEQFGHLLLELAKLGAEVTEVVFHVECRVERRGICI
jgi:hypothetical protein